MSPIVRHRIARRLSIFCLVLVFGSGSIGIARADARVLEVGAPPTKELTEAVGGVVGTLEEVGGAATSQAPEAVTKPVESVAAPVQEAVEEASSAVAGATGATGSAKPAPESGPPSPPPVGGGGSTGSDQVGKVGGAAATVAGSAAGAAGPRSSGRTTGAGAGSTASAGTGSTATATPVQEPEETPESVTAGPRSSADPGPAPDSATDRGARDSRATVGGDKLDAPPSSDGSVRAPVPKWVAYVWPAVALSRPDLAALLVHSAQDGLRLALDPSGTIEAGDGPTGSLAVAGVHASHDARSSDSSSSHGADFPTAIRNAAAQIHEQPLAYLLVAALLAAGVAAALKIEFGRRSQGKKK